MGDKIRFVMLLAFTVFSFTMMIYGFFAGN